MSKIIAPLSDTSLQILIFTLLSLTACRVDSRDAACRESEESAAASVACRIECAEKRDTACRASERWAKDTLIVERDNTSGAYNYTLIKAKHDNKPHWLNNYLKYLYVTHADDDTFLHVGEMRLAFIDDDTIPELLILGKCEAEGIAVLTQSHNRVHAVNTWRLYLEYIPRAGLCCYQNAHMEYYEGRVWKVENGTFSELASYWWQPHYDYDYFLEHGHLGCGDLCYKGKTFPYEEATKDSIFHACFYSMGEPETLVGTDIGKDLNNDFLNFKFSE